jgi:hypothetical protein
MTVNYRDIFISLALDFKLKIPWYFTMVFNTTNNGGKTVVLFQNIGTSSLFMHYVYGHITTQLPSVLVVSSGNEFSTSQ